MKRNNNKQPKKNKKKNEKKNETKDDGTLFRLLGIIIFFFVFADGPSFSSSIFSDILFKFFFFFFGIILSSHVIVAGYLNSPLLLFGKRMETNRPEK
jgi:hypothetical protein